MPLREIGTALEAANALAERLPKNLSPTAVELFKTLCAVGLETAKAKGYKASITHMVFHLPQEVLAKVLGIHPVTVWRNLKVLKDLGVVAARAHKSTLRGQTRNSGLVIQIRLDPAKGSKARLSYDDLKHPWRDLMKDVYAKKTAHRQVKELDANISKSSIKLDITELLVWTLPPKPETTPVIDCLDDCTSKKDALYALLDVKNAPKEEKNRSVRLAAEALAFALADSGSVSWYQKLIWQLLRGYAIGQDHFQSVFLAAQRAMVDSQEGFARKSGALLVSRLKESGLFDEIMGFPKLRVGNLPS